MSKVTGPKHGSMQFWPRKRAKSNSPRLRAKLVKGQGKIDSFCGYKVGMTHVMVKDTGSTSINKNQIVSKPVTIIECPAMKVAGVRLYKKSGDVLVAVSDIFSNKLDKNFSKSFKLNIPKEKTLDNIDKEFDDLRLIVYTQPSQTSTGAKKPDIIEVAVGGSKEEKINYAKEKLGQEIDVSELYDENDLIDIHGITRGKGYQGSVKRFGIQIRAKKSEKTKRGPGSLGSWCGQQHMMYRVPQAGQMGYHLRTEYNKCILSISDDPSKINPKGGFVNYGNVKSKYLLVTGSVAGHIKRMVRLAPASRPNPKKKTDSLNIVSISTISKQR